MQLLQPIMPVLTSLPASPVDGQIICYQPTAGVVQLLRYNLAATRWDNVANDRLQTLGTTGLKFVAGVVNITMAGASISSVNVNPGLTTLSFAVATPYWDGGYGPRVFANVGPQFNGSSLGITIQTQTGTAGPAAAVPVEWFAVGT
jgi:hypothetical protein